MKTKTYKARLADYTAKISATSEPVEFKAEASDGTPAGPKKFSAIAYSGEPIPGYTATPKLPHAYVIDLAGTTKARNIHANLDHKTEKRVGHLTEVDNDGKRIAVEGVLSAATTYRDEVANGAADGQPWEVSIECALGSGKLIPKGNSATVNGRKLEGPFIRFTKNKFTDIAFVSHGADGGNEVKIAASTAGATTMTEFDKFMAACGVDPDTATDEQKGFLKDAFEAKHRTNGATTEPLSFEAKAEEVRLEQKRRDTISSMALTAMRENPLYYDQIKALATLAMDNGTKPQDFELEVLRGTRTRPGLFSNHPNQADPIMIEAALCMASGLPDIEKHYTPQVLDGVSRSGMRNFSLQQMLMQVASANGMTCRAGERIHNGNIREVLEYCFPPTIARLATGFSTISLTNILGNVANKEILAGYMEEDTTWREIATIKSVSNFQLITSYRMLDSLEYEEIGPTGMIQHGTLSEESYTRQAKTYAKMLGITRTDIINDDLSAFDDVRARLGRGAAKKFNNIFWAAFINNSTFYTTALTNYLAGATTNLGSDGVGLGLGVLTYRKMTSPTADSTKRVGVGMSRPSIMLVPPELEAIAMQLYASRNLITGANTTVGDANIYGGLYRPVVQNRLSDSAFTGYSLTAWYLFGDDLKPMVVSFLNGQQTPNVESADADFNQLGIQFRGYHDFGADKSEYLAGTKLKGIA